MTHDHEEHDHCCHGHHHHHHHDDECCHEHHHDHEHGGFAEQLLELADEAWMEVLKEKIKKHIESGDGKNLDELAKLVSDANHQRWSSKLAENNTKHNFKDKLENFFSKK
jgi:hypothetical protein